VRDVLANSSANQYADKGTHCTDSSTHPESNGVAIRSSIRSSDGGPYGGPYCRTVCVANGRT